MEKAKVTFNQLLSGAILKFGKLDSVDITLLISEISKRASVVNNDCEYTNEYFMMADGGVFLIKNMLRKFIRV